MDKKIRLSCIISHQQVHALIHALQEKKMFSTLDDMLLEKLQALDEMIESKDVDQFAIDFTEAENGD